MDLFLLWDFLTQSFAWIYRGWAFILSENYRYVIRKTWTTKPNWFKYFDITGSIAFMSIEFYVILLYTGVVGDFYPPT